VAGAGGFRVKPAVLITSAKAPMHRQISSRNVTKKTACRRIIFVIGVGYWDGPRREFARRFASTLPDTSA
jgi:hypothetical protein